MVKGFIHIRVDEDVKEKFEKAAERQGKTLTRFVLDAALTASERESEQKVAKRGCHGGVPTYFRGWCQEAARGGQWGYSQPAYHLTIHLEQEVPHDVSLAEWSQRIEKLIALLKKTDEEGIWDWFQTQFPRCLRLVPRRRWRQFVRGVQAAYEEGRIG